MIRKDFYASIEKESARAFFGYHIGTGGKVYWFVNVSQQAASAKGGFDMIVNKQWQERMLSLFQDDLPRVSELIRATDSPIIGYPIYDIFTQPIWQKGPVVLVGDAIHAISPSAGQGASLAMENAIVLAKCLRDIPETSEAFTAYEHLRRKRVEHMVRYARSLGQGKVITNPIQVGFRDLLIPFFLKRFANPAALDWAYSYKVDWDEPVKASS